MDSPMKRDYLSILKSFMLMGYEFCALEIYLTYQLMKVKYRKISMVRVNSFDILV